MTVEKVTPIEAVSMVAMHLTEAMLIAVTQSEIDTKNLMLWGRIARVIQEVVPTLERLRKSTEAKQ
jgi:mannose/cellobiose epimerase-like protein (N-acyl-D-glucosamine 2-epimerase family)